MRNWLSRPLTLPRRLRYLLAVVGGIVIGFLTGAASLEAAAPALGFTFAHAAWLGGLVGALGGAATGAVAADG
jgi:hypothetical protein